MNPRISTLLHMAMLALLTSAFIPEAIAAAPTVTSNAASGVTDTSATLNATVNDNGESTAVSFEAGTSVAYGTTLSATTGATVGAGAGNTAGAVTVTGLSCNSTYHYRAKGVNGSGTVFGGDQSFTTLSCAVGTCGSDNGLTLTVPPTNLCATGTAGIVTANSTTYDWTCNGIAAGSPTSCSAVRNYVATASVSGVTNVTTGNGTISANQTVVYNATPSFTLTPNTGYFAAPVTGTCGGTLTGNTFVTSPVTASCTVVANFALIPVRNAYFINASTSTNKTSVLRLVNPNNQSATISATAYDEAGNVVGTANTSLSTIAAQQTLTFTSSQLESAIGYTPSSGTAKYHIVFTAKLTSFEVINFIKDVASGNLTLAQAQLDNRVVSTASSSVRNMLIENPSTNLTSTSVVRLINTTTQSGQVTATAYGETGNILGIANTSLGSIAPQQMLTFTSSQLESALGYLPSSSSAKYRIAFSANLSNFETLNFIKDTATGNLTLAQAQTDSRIASAATSSVRNALMINASTSLENTSLVRLINLDVGIGSIGATAYNEAGLIVGRAGTNLGTIGSLQILAFTSAQLEAAIGYTPSSGNAKYRIVFTGTLPSFELVNYLVDPVRGNLILAQAQIDNRNAGATTSSTRNAFFLNSSTSTNKTSVVHLINLGDQNGLVTATAYGETGSVVGTPNSTIGILAAQQMSTFTSAQLESLLGYVPTAPTAKYRVVFNANLPNFEVVNFVSDVATGSITLGQSQVD